MVDSMIEQSASLSPPTSLQNPESYCSLCQQDHSIELLTLCGPLIGPFEFKSNSLYFHLYCLYFSWDVWIDSMTNINQELHKSFFIFPKLREINPSNEEKLLILPNIRNVLGNYQRTSLHRCDICQKIRATVACSISNCPSQYHFPCAQGYVKFFYCSMAFILEKGSYGMIRPCRFVLCDKHAEWQSEWIELHQYLQTLDNDGVMYYDVDKFPLHLQQLVSRVSEISFYQPNTLRMVSVEKHIYSVQSVLGPRDMFPAYTVQNLKSTASRLLIQSVGDYPVSSKENCESNATAEKISHKRLRPQENNIMNKTDKDKKIKHNIEDVPLKDSHSQVIQSPGNQKQGMSKQNFEDFQHFNSTTPPTNTSNYAANVRHKLITQSPGDIDEKHFLTSPFERWNIKFEGFPQKQNVVSDTSSAGTGNEHQRFDCGICGSYVSEEKFRCTTCSLVVHKSCLQHTTLKDQLANSKNSTHWSCPVCSLIEFCSKHPVNGVDSLDRDYFTCIFCPTKEPLIMMERMKSGLFTHSLCKFIINVEEESMQRCSICGLEGTGLSKCGEKNCSTIFHASCGWKNGYALCRSIETHQEFCIIGFCQRHGPICPSRIQTSKISDPISTVSEIVHELSCDNVSDTCTTLGTGDNVPATNASGNQEGILASSISIDATTDTNQPASLLLLSDTLPESPEKIVLPDKIGVEETICDPTIRVPDSSLRVGVKASIVDTMTSASTSRKTTSFFEFQFGEEKNSKFSGVATLIPLRKTALSQEIIDMSSFNWTKIITNEKFERAQLEFRGGFKDTTLSCVLGVEVSSRLDLKLEPYRKDAFGCILERWEFLFLIHKSHFIYPIMVQECSSSMTEDNNIEESNSILIKCQYFLLGFSRGWRSTQKKPTLSNIPQKKKLKPSQEFSKSNYIIKDFGKAKLLTQPVILTPTTTIISSGLRKDNSSTHGGQLSKGGTRDSQQQRKPKQPKIISEGDASYGTSIKNEQITHDQSISNKIDLSSTSISINPLSNEYHGHSHFGQVVACEGNFANEMIPLHEMEYGISDLTSVPYDSLEHQN